MIRTLALAALGAPALLLAACGPGCETRMVDAITSPDDSHEVRVWLRTCGARTTPALHFELVEADAPQRDIARREQVFLVGEGAREDYALSWRAPGALTVALGGESEAVLKAEPDLEVGERTVVISYSGPGAG